MISRGVVVFVLAVLACVSIPGTAAAQNRGCVVEQAPDLDFMQPAANPTERTTTTTQVVVRCTGNGSEGGTQVRVCLGLNPPAGLGMQRQMTVGASQLQYQIFRDSSYSGQPVGLNQTSASAVLTLTGSQSHPSGTATITLYGLIPAGQTGLGTGVHIESLSGELHSTTNLTAGGCASAMPHGTFSFTARADLRASCSIVANDLAFGVHNNLTADITGTAALGLTCSANAAYTVRIDGGNTGNPADRRMRRGGIGAETIRYDLFQNSTHTQSWGNTPATSFGGVGTGSPIALIVHGLVPGGQPTPSIGDYRDTVTVTLEY